MMGMGFPQMLLLAFQLLVIGTKLAKQNHDETAATVVGVCIVQAYLWWGGWYGY